MGALLFVLLLVIPVAELWMIVQVAQGIGVLETFALLIVISIAGAWLLKQQGTATWVRLQQTLQRGEMPTNAITDGALILFGGALLLTPGFLTDIVGLLFLLPPTRAAIKGTARRGLGAWAKRRWAPAVTTARVVRSYRTEQESSNDPGRLPPPQDRSAGEDGSPDKG